MLSGVRVLSVGIERYGTPDLDRRGPAANALRFATLAADLGIDPTEIVVAISRLGVEPDFDKDRLVGATAAAIKAQLDAAHGYDNLIVYWCGHGAIPDRSRGLLTADPIESTSLYIDFEDLERYLSRPWSPRRQTLFIDACATFDPKLGTTALVKSPALQVPNPTPPGPERLSIFSAVEGQRAQLDPDGGSLFSNTLLRWLKDAPKDETGLPDFDQLPEVLTSAYRDAENRGRLPQNVRVIIDQHGDKARYAYTRTLEQELGDDLAEDLSGPFSATRNSFRGHDPLRGRGRALTDLASWLRTPDPAPRIITGGAECGKTALLGTLALAASKLGGDREFTATLALPEPALAAAVVATKRPTYRIMQHIAYAAGIREGLNEIPAPGGLAWAVRRIRELPHQAPRTVLLDAVDEAEDLAGLCGDVLAPLIGEPGPLRLILGARPNILEVLRSELGREPPEAWVIDLDGEYADPDALREVVEDALAQVETESGHIWSSAGWDQYHHAADTIARVADTSFGVARTLASAQRDVAATGRPEWESSLPSEAGEAYFKGLEIRLGDKFPAARDLLLPLSYARGDGMPAWVVEELVRVLSGGRRPSRVATGDLLTGPHSAIEARSVGGPTCYRIRSVSLATYLQQSRDTRADEATIAECLVGIASSVGGGRRVWHTEARRYVGRHLVDHARCAQNDLLDRLITDGGFLLLAEPAQVLTHCAGIEEGPLRTSLAAYRDALPLDGQPKENAARLLLAARCHRDDALASSLLALPSADRPVPRAEWAAWRQETPHRRLSTRPHNTRLLAAAGTASRAVLLSASGDQLLHWALDAHGKAATSLCSEVRVDALVTVSGGNQPPLAVVATPESLTLRDAITGEEMAGGSRSLPQPATALAAGWVDDGLVVVVGDATGAVRLFRWHDRGWTEREGVIHARPITALALIGDDSGAHAVSASLDGNVRCWPYLRPSEAKPYLGHTGTVRAMVSTRRMEKEQLRDLVASAGEDGLVRIWDPANPEERTEPLAGHEAWIRTLARARFGGGDLLLSGGDGGRVIVWDVNTSTRVGAPYQGHPDRVEALAVVEVDGRVTVALAGARGAVRVWELAEAGPIGEPFHGHSGPVRALHVLPGPAGTERLVSAGGDGTVVLWDGYTGLPLGRPLRSHDGWVGTLAVTGADEPEVITGGADGRVLAARLTASGLMPAQPVAEVLDGWISALTRDGDRLLWACCLLQNPERKPTVIWVKDAGQSSPRHLYDGHQDWVRAIVTLELPDGTGTRRVALSAGADPEVHVWDALSGTPLSRIRVDAGGEIRTLAVSTDDLGQLVLSTGDDGWIRRFRPGTAPADEWHQERLVKTPHSAGLLALAVPPGAGHVVAAGVDGGIYAAALHPSETPTELVELTRHAGPVRGLAIGTRANRTVVYSGSADSTIRAWYLDTGREVLPAHTDWVRAVSTGRSGAGPVVVSGGDDGTLRAWNLADGSLRWNQRHPHGRPIRAVACVSVDGGDIVVSGSTAGDLRVWNLADGTPLPAPAERHDDWVRCLAVTDHALVSGGGDGMFRLWKWDAEQKMLRTMTKPQPVDDNRQWIRAIGMVAGSERWQVATCDEDGRFTVSETGIPSSPDAEDPAIRLHPSAPDDRFRTLTSVRLGGTARIVVGGSDGLLRGWAPGEAGTSQLPALGSDGSVGEPVTAEGEVSALAAHDGMAEAEFDRRPRLAVASGPHLSTWSWIAGKQAWQRDWQLTTRAEILSLAFSPDADRLVLGTRMGVAVVTAD
jgi:WD40 repeat protein